MSTQRKAARWALLAAATMTSAFGQVGFGGLGGFGNGGRLADFASGNAPQSNRSTLTPFASVNGTFSHELSGQPDLFFNRVNSYGASATAGLTGARSWQRSGVSFGYVGSLNYWPQARSRWSSNHIGVFAAEHRHSARLTTAVQAIAGTSIGGYGYGAGFGGFTGGSTFAGLGLDASALSSGMLGSAAQNGLVDTELVSRRANYSATSGSAQYQLSERWAVTGAGGTAFVRRASGGFGSDSQYASGSLQYSFSRRTAVGGMYQQSWMRYPGLFGGVQGQSAGLQFNHKISSRTDFSVFAGVMRARSEFVGAIPLPPDVAELLGTSTSYQFQRLRLLTSGFGANLSSSASNWNWGVNFSRGMSPGNGVLLTSIRDSAGLHLTYNGNSRFAINGDLTGSRQTGLIGYLVTIYHYQASISTGYRILNQLYWNVGAGYRNVQFPAQPHRQGVTVFTGLTWTPRELAISF